MGAIYGALSALGIALLDVPGRRLNRVAGHLTTAASIQLFGACAVIAGLFVIDSAFSVNAVVLGAVSGLGMGVGLWGYYASVGHASAALGSPIVATLSAVLPYAYTLVRGAAPSGLAMAGAGVSLVGLVFVTSSGTVTGDKALGARYALISGLGYGVGISVLVDVSDEAGAWPAPTQRIAAFLLMAVLARRGAQRLLAPVGHRGAAAAGGILAAATTIFYLLGLEADASSAVVTASLFPVGTVIVGKVTQGDEVRPGHVLGIAVALTGVIAVAVG